jgi:hypothetical protein
MQLRFHILGARKENLVSDARVPPWLTSTPMLILIAFLYILIDRDSMGQQHRVRAKRKRRLAYLRRKRASTRAAATRSVPSKQPAQKEASSAE